eukprot:5443276-Amphidinium_carterae.7
MQGSGHSLSMCQKVDTQQLVPDIVLAERTVMSTLRVRGIAVENPLKIKKKSGIQSLCSGSPDEVGDAHVYIDYLQAKGIASESAIRYPTREWYKEHFLVPSSQPLSQVTLRTMVAEGVDVENNAMERVEGMWILNGYVMKGDDDQMESHLKILEVGPEGPPRRASVLRRMDPSSFRHPKWNGSPECLTVGVEEFFGQFVYANKHGRFGNVTDPEVWQTIRIGEVPVTMRPTEYDCAAVNRYCGPCGGKYGQVFPCMLCMNWAHMGCSYGVEGGRVCASHVAVLDAGEGLAMIISDPSERLVGTILRPTRVYGRASSAKRQRPSKANRWENETTEHARRWEQIAMYKAIWLAAGLQYELRSEETGVDLKPSDRGLVERITRGHPWLSSSKYQGQTAFPCLLGSTRAYVEQTRNHHRTANLDKTASAVQRRWRFKHLAHQYQTTYRSSVTEIYLALPTPDQHLDLFGRWGDGGIVDLECLQNSPENYERSPFVTLTYANEFDQALEFQPLVVKGIARKAAMYDMHMGVPHPILMHEVVRPDNCQSYLRDENWPLASLTIGYVTQSQYEHLWDSDPDVDMTEARDDEANSVLLMRT